MKNINFKSKEAESYYLNKMQGKSIKEMSENRQVSTRTIEREISSFKEQIKDLEFDEVINSFAEVSVSYGNAEINKATIDSASIKDLEEGKYYFYKNSTDELLFVGSLDDFFDEYDEYDKRWKKVISGRHIKDSFLLKKIDLRIKCDFNKKYMTTEDRVNLLENKIDSQQREIEKLKKFINTYLGEI